MEDLINNIVIIRIYKQNIFVYIVNYIFVYTRIYIFDSLEIRFLML